MRFGLGVPGIQKESDSDNSERSNTDPTGDAFESPESSPTRFNPNTAEMANNPPNNPNDPLLSLQTQLSEMKAGFEAIVQQQNQTIANLANLATSRLQPPEPPPTSYADLMLRQFIKDPVQTHDRTNPQKPILAFDGSNYVEWEKAIDRTLQHAFVRDSPFIEDSKYDNFDALGIIENKKVAELMRNTLHKDLLTIVESEGLSSAKDIFKSLREKCKRSGQRHKVILINRIIKFAGERLPASESWLARFCTIMTDVERANISINEFAGLLLQSLAAAPPGVDSKNFEYSINQPLDDMRRVPTLGEVTTVIQSALSKIASTGQLPPGTIPSDVEMSVQAMRTQSREFYKPLQKRSEDQHHSNGGNSTKFSVDKASFYKGKGHSDSLLAKFGYACLYCRETGHWYADCKHYWQDVRQGRIEAPPSNHNESGSRFLPPNRPPPTQQNGRSNGRIRKIDIPDANDGTILLDSGSTINAEDSNADGDDGDQ
ncbi:hypothetical protein PGT21_050268 [Puccinia graminis f. sp. tritici]|uniref:Dcp1p-Dcp2p decapping enzyme complex alpha subunit n=1 Tax=Puccinia graminis f. sp. tritici TaxID=56615 RepID=A0A5B0NW25_PUCGR|nr:hypothetical protein PGT21_050268 [Puccinia graminis f. sp. tritici]KAA1093335.1 hypothetical protein PGTUg99_050203 [Puccinia graminis f. sp. tritici]